MAETFYINCLEKAVLNIKDHEPLAKALGKTAFSPNQILAKDSDEKPDKE